MSYDILYNSVCIKSTLGISPVVLSGPSNVYECGRNGRSGRRARDWSCYGNFIGAKVEDFLQAVSNLTGGKYQEHWMHHGKWVDDAGIMRWARKMVASASSIEDILVCNGLRDVYCYVSVWDEKSYGRHECAAYARTTAELDKWIAEAKTFIAEQKEKGYGAYPTIRFGREEISVPPADDHATLIKGDLGYLVNAGDGTMGWCWCRSRKEGTAFTKEEAKQIMYCSIIPMGIIAQCVKK